MVKGVMVVEVGWSRSGFSSDGKGRGPCQIVKFKVHVKESKSRSGSRPWSDR